MSKETYVYVVGETYYECFKRDLLTFRKRPMTCQKRPMYMSWERHIQKESYLHAKNQSMYLSKGLKYTPKVPIQKEIYQKRDLSERKSTKKEIYLKRDL